MMTPAFKRPFKRFRERVAADEGLTLIEVAVSGLMVSLIALSLVGLDAAGKTTADQRRRAQAFEVAQADQERIKGLSADQIAHLNQTRTVTLDNVAYTVTSTGQFLNSAADSASCAAGAAAADYAKVISTVDWASNRRADIVVQSTVTPRAGGALVARRARPEHESPAGRARGRRRRGPEHRRRAAIRHHRRGRLRHLRDPAASATTASTRRSPATSIRAATQPRRRS